jgi:hypothetical protein
MPRGAGQRARIGGHLIGCALGLDVRSEDVGAGFRPVGGVAYAGPLLLDGSGTTRTSTK